MKALHHPAAVLTALLAILTVVPIEAAAADLAVTWSVTEGAGGGAVGSTGLYAAPASAGTYHVVVTSRGDPSKTAVATVTVSSQPQVAISVSPSTASAATGGTVQLSATVTGSSDTAVTWSVAEGSAGGSVSTSGLYTAPSTAGTYHAVATSHADATKNARATLTVTGGTTPPAADCATAPLRTTGPVYYYCDCQTGLQGGAPDPACVPGNDSNAGTSPSAPRRSLSDAFNRFNSMAAGSTVALCRGGAWSGGGDFTNSSCTSGNGTCDFRDYVPSWGSLSTPRPRLASGGTILAIQNAPYRGNYRIWNIDARNPAQGGANGVVLIYNGNFHDVDFCGLRVDGGWLGVYFEPTGTTPNNISLRGSQIYNGQFSGFYGGSPGVTITGNYFEGNGINTGSGGMLMHSVYLISETAGGVPPDASGGEGAATYTFSNNEIVEGNYCDGVMLVVHGVFSGNRLVLENNKLSTTSTNPQCYGFQTAGGLSGAEFHNVSFSRNRLLMNGNTGVEFSCCKDCVMSDNLIVNGGLSVSTSDCNAGSFTGGHVTLQNNTFYNGGMTIGSYGTGPYDLDNNAAFQDGGTCYNTTLLGRNNNNYCRTSGTAVGSVFVNAPGGNFLPVAGGPLAGTGNSSYYSNTAIGTVNWSAADAGVPRTVPVDVGAFER